MRIKFIIILFYMTKVEFFLFRKDFIMKYGPLFGISDKLRTPEELIANVKQFEAEGAHGIVLLLDELERKYWNVDDFRKIFSAACRMEIYASFYRSENSAGVTDDERAEYLLMAAEAGADIVDIMGDMFDSQEDELSCDPAAIAKQKSLAAEIKKYGAAVLMSSHVKKFRATEDALKYFYAHYERGVDISKVVFTCNSECELAESRRISEELCTNLPIPFVHVCGGSFGKDIQRYETLLNGSLMTFVRCHDNDVQPSVKKALEFLQRHTPWAAAANRSDCGEFIGRTAVITGAASGMGLLAARKFAAGGAAVLLVDINENALDNAVKEIRDAGGKACSMVADVRKYADAEKAAQTALAEFGRIDYLLCFAGGFESRCCNSYKMFYEQPIEVIDWGLEVNLKGPIYFARACMPAMIKQKSGVIICMGSISGMEGNASGPMYGTSKIGLSHFVKGLALAGAPYNVRAVCVAPGPVLTRPEMSKLKTPLGRAAEVVEVVDLVMLMCSDRSSFITGSTHFIDGGYLAK